VLPSGKDIQVVQDDAATRAILLAVIQQSAVHAKPVVLVVEDDQAVGKMLDVALRLHGFVVRLAASGGEAVEHYREHHPNIALVLLDVQMLGMDGPATLAAIQKINPEVQCCFMSGHTGKYSARELLDMGAAHVLPKPFVSVSLLIRLLWDMVDARPSQEPLPGTGGEEGRDGREPRRA
jgi:CheY-like chemotaxis protein